MSQQQFPKGVQQKISAETRRWGAESLSLTGNLAWRRIGALSHLPCSAQPRWPIKSVCSLTISPQEDGFFCAFAQCVAEEVCVQSFRRIR